MQQQNWPSDLLNPEKKEIVSSFYVVVVVTFKEFRKLYNILFA